MAKSRTDQKTGGHERHKTFWDESWVDEVMRSKVSSRAKLLYVGWIGGFPDGCRKVNEEMGSKFGWPSKTVQRAIAELKKAGWIWIEDSDNRCRKIWPKRHPAVLKRARQAWEAAEREGRRISEDESYHEALRRKPRTQTEVSGLPGQKCPPTQTEVSTNPDRSVWVQHEEELKKNLRTEKKQADSSLPADGQPNPPAKAKMQAVIRAELEKRMPPRERGDLAEGVRRLDLSLKLQESIEGLIAGGLSFAEAMDKVYNENLELINGGKQK